MNTRIKRLVKLRDRRHRDREGVFVVEGERLVTRALEAGLMPVEIYVDGTVAIQVGITPVSVAPDVLDKASYRNRSEGLIAVFPQFETSLDSAPEGATSLVVAAESIEKPGNLGAMIRLADAAGAGPVIAISSTADVFSPNTIRASTGAVFDTPIALADLDELFAWADVLGIEVAAAHPKAPTTVWDLDMTGPTCILVGAEDVGLSPEALSAAHTVFSIPMAGMSDSLNVASAVGVSLFEAVRQRRGG